MTIENLKCPECQGEMISRKGKFGIFWGCSNYPKCRGTRDSEGRSREERNAEKSTADLDNSEFSKPSRRYDEENSMFQFRRKKE